MLANADVRRAMISNLTEEDYSELATGAIFTAIIRACGEGLEPDFQNLWDKIEGEAERAFLPALLMSDLSWAGDGEFDTLFKAATEAISSLRRRQLERRLDLIQIEIGQAEREQDSDRLLRLYQQKTEIKRRKLALSVA
jgi:hypothetical protein